MEKINSRRLGNTFLELASIDSPSGSEGEIAARVKKICSEELGMEVREDNSKKDTGAGSGNIAATFNGSFDVPPLFFNAHLDTVEPGIGVMPVLENGIFFSQGDTVLGADDKAGISIMIEAMRIVQESGIECGILEMLFTVSEEIGLVGAKAMDPDFIKARYGYALDSSYPDAVITNAPEAIKFEAEFVGKAAHAGLQPEQGISAIQMAAKAVAGLNLGRIDEETTANIGLVSGGQANNIIPERCVLSGEVRSHKKEKLARTRDSILEAMHKACVEAAALCNTDEGRKDAPPFLRTVVKEDYPLMAVPETSPLVTTVLNAGEKLGRDLKLTKTGGGSDANIFNGKGIETIILGIGMNDVHTTQENIHIDDMIRTTALVVEIIKKWGR